MDCEARGTVEIVALSNGLIQWPIAVVPGSFGRSLVLYRDLVRAVRRETATAVAHAWGVTLQTVTKWRKALGVKKTEANTRWRVAFGKSPAMRKALDAMHAKARDPERREKIAAAKRGKKRPAEVIEKMRRANLGRKATAATRAKLSAAQQSRPRRGRLDLQPWTAAELAILAEPITAAAMAQKTGRTLAAVNLKRRRLKMPDARRRSERIRKGRSE